MGLFSERLRLLRAKMGITQKDVADALGIANSTYSLYEKGAREPNFDILQQLSDFYNVSVDYLLGVIDDEPSTIAAHFDGEEFTDEELKEIKQFVEFVKMKRPKDNK